MSSGCRRLARGADLLAAARARLPGRAVDDLEALLHAVARRLLHPRTRRADDRERLLVGDVAGAPPRVDAAGEAALDLPQVADPGDDPLVEDRVADRPCRIVLAQPPQERRLVELGGEDVRPSFASRRSKRTRLAVISSSTGPLSWATTLSPRRIGARWRAASGQSASRTRHLPLMRRCEWIVRPLSKRRNRCLPCASTEVTAWPASFSGQRSRPKRGCGVSIASGTCPRAPAGSCSRCGGWCRLQALGPVSWRRDDACPSPHQWRCARRSR